MINVIKIRDNRIYVVIMAFDRDEPLVKRAWFATGTPAYLMKREEIPDGSPLKYDAHTGTYVFKFSGDPYSRGIQIRLENGRQTPAEFEDTIEVPPPRTKRKGNVIWTLLSDLSSSAQWCLETRTKTGMIKVLDLPQPRLQEYALK
jgi:hypothetical protein